MKKLLTILGSVGLIATTSAAVIACGDRTPNIKQKEEKTKPSETPKKEDSKKEEMKQEEFQPKFSDVENKTLGNF
ncbi:lipoprotein [Mycoplasma mycoides]|uniref:lipoprotein n=1 Tax=Mycoplasma mycoides TaxID=2102 RepID=UPI002ACDBC33|nr:lipoprotein [Mycoplasma mycoides]